ncbi:MAG: POTRA domain-containing protein [Bradymonadia bacterium]
MDSGLIITPQLWRRLQWITCLLGVLWGGPVWAQIDTTGAEAEARSCEIGKISKIGEGLTSSLSRRNEDGIKADRARIIAEGLPFEGVEIASISLGCDSPECDEPRTYDALYRMTRLRRGEPLTAEQLANAWTSLIRLFKEVRIVLSCRPPANGSRQGVVEVQFLTIGHHIIEKLDIRYSDLLSRLYPRVFSRDIRKRIRFKRGGVWPEGNAERIDRERRKILDYYERLGYQGTKVNFDVEYTGPYKKRVNLTVEITEGTQPWLGEVLLKGNEAMSYADVVSQLSTGEVADFWRPLFGAFGIGKLEKRVLRQELTAVEKNYREEGWLTARVRLVDLIEGDGEVQPLVQVYEGPRVQVRFEGNEKISDESLAALLTFVETGSIDETELEGSRESIREAYEAIGHYFVEIDIDPPVRTTDSKGNEVLRIVFNIDERRQVYIRRINIKGNRGISTEKIKEVMGTKGLGGSGVVTLFSSDSILQDARIINDLTAIRDMYEQQGYQATSFRCQAPVEKEDYWIVRRLQEDRNPEGPFESGRFDIWTRSPSVTQCYVVEPTLDPRLVDVTLELHEGARTTTERLDVDRFLKWMNEEWRDRLYDTLVGQGFMDDRRRWRTAGFNGSKLQDVEGIILNWLHHEGYRDAQVIARCGYESAPGVSCRNELPYGAALDTIYFEVYRGPRLITDGMMVWGNTETEQDAIRAELRMKDRAPLSTDDLFVSESNLRRLGIFNSVKIETIQGTIENSNQLTLQQADPSQDNSKESLTTVLVTVEESDTVLFESSVGAQVSNAAALDATDIPVLYILGLGLRDQNFLGKALQLGGAAEHANRITRPTDIEGDDALWLGRIFLTDRSVAGTQLDFSQELTYSRSRTAQQDRYVEQYALTSTLGYEFYNLSYPELWGRGLRATLSVEASRERRRRLTTADERPPFQDPVTSVTVGPTIRWDKRDSPLHPTRGFLLELSATAVFQGDLTDTVLTVPAFKETIFGQVVMPFFDRRLLIVPTLSFGAAQTDLGDDDLPVDFLFKAGGDVVVAHPTRGYEPASIDKCGADPACFAPDTADTTELDPIKVGGNALALGSLEARFPTFVMDDLWGGVFLDAAAVSGTWGEMSSDDIYPSVGTGLRYLVAGQIPVRLDVGFPLRTPNFGSRGAQFTFNIFYTP